MTIKITFDLRDWSKGQRILQQLGFLEEGDTTLTEQHTIQLDDTWQEQIIREELEGSGVGFELETL